MERQANLQRKQPCQRHMKVCGMHARGESREGSMGCSSRLGLKVKGVGFHPCSGVTIGGQTLSLVNSVMTNQEYSNVSSEPWWVVTPQR